VGGSHSIAIIAGIIIGMFIGFYLASDYKEVTIRLIKADPDIVFEETIGLETYKYKCEFVD